MANPFSLLIRCIDASGKAFKVDSITLDSGEGKREILTAAPFRFKISSAFEGVVEIRKSNHHAWNFPIRVSDSKGELAFNFHDKLLSPPAMASIASIAASADGKHDKEYLCDFTLGDCREVVLVSGVDYHGGSKNIVFATTRMHDLWSTGTINAQTVVTVFDCDTGMRERWVKGQGQEKSANFKFTSGWSLLEKVLQGTAAPIPVTGGGDPGANCISITHVYRHIEECGQTRPGSLIEFSVFSHSWFGGPILFNTGERAEYDSGGAKFPQRDPLDHDARFWKDFDPINMPNLAHFKAAFSPTAFLKIWGCLAVTAFRNALNMARKAKSDVATLGVPEEDRTDFFTGLPYPDTRPGILEFLGKSAFKSNYMHALSTATGRPVFGGAPGLGALLLFSGKWGWMYMPEYRLELKAGIRINMAPVYNNELHYMKSALGWKFSDDWYLEYK